jgi:hypothetical protein
MHDGSLETLYDVAESSTMVVSRIRYLNKEMRPLGLIQDEVDDLCSFLGAFTSDPFSAVGGPELDRQQANVVSVPRGGSSHYEQGITLTYRAAHNQYDARRSYGLSGFEIGMECAIVELCPIDGLRYCDLPVTGIWLLTGIRTYKPSVSSSAEPWFLNRFNAPAGLESRLWES